MGHLRLWRTVALLAVATGAAGMARAELIGYWPLDGDATAVVGTDGVLVNGPTATTDRNGAAGGGLAFDGAAQQHVAIAGGGGLDGAAAATVSLWVQWNGSQDGGWNNRNGAVMGRQNNRRWSDDVLCIYPTTDPNTANINWEARVGAGINSGVQPASGVWHHVAATMAPGGQVLYVDGVATSTRGSFAGHRSDPSKPLTLGGWIGDGASYSTSRMDDVAVWDAALSPGQVAALAAQMVTPQTAGTKLVAPVSARASSELTAGHNRRVGNVVDGVGHTTTAPNGWPSDEAGMWLSAPGDTTPTITFDLGGVHALDGAVVHNYNEAGGPPWTTRGVQQANVSISTDNVTYTPIGAVTLAQATGNAVNPGQVLPLGGVEARYVRAEVLSNHGDTSYTGLNEVEFLGTPVEPMPIRGVSATASSSLREGGFDRRPVHLIDGTGLFADGHSTVPDAAMWLSDGIGFGAPGDDGDPELIFDLGGEYSVSAVRVWNYNEAVAGRPELLGRGVQQVEILASLDGLSFTPLGVFDLAIAPGVDGADFSETLDLGGADARFIQFDILSNHNGVQFPTAGGADNAFVGLSEVRFFAIDRIPEPATLAVLGGGLLVLWRRRRHA